MKKLIMVVVLTPMMALATTWYVDGSAGADSYSGTSSSAAKKTIQAAIDASTAGDTILVAPGTYDRFAADNKRIWICSTGGATATVIDGLGDYVRGNELRLAERDNVAGVVTTNTVLEGFTVQRLPNIVGGTVRRCIIRDNDTWSIGGAACNVAVVEDCLIVNNRGMNGSAADGSILRNCTMVGNSARDINGVCLNSVLENCIAYGNGNDERSTWQYWFDQNPLVSTVGYREKNIYTDNPNFVDAANGDYRLAAGSPCIDAGDNSYVTGDKDLAGNARIVNGKVDIGCYEYGASSIGSGLYIVIDLSGGTSASRYPVTYLDSVPSGGWTDEYKTTKLVLRRIEPGTFIMGSPEGEIGRYSERETQRRVTLTKAYYIGVFEITQQQWELVMGSSPSQYAGMLRPVESVSYDMIRGSDAGAGWPVDSRVDNDSFIGVLRTKTGLVSFDLPTSAQWEYACRAGTSTAFNNGTDASSELEDENLSQLGRYDRDQQDGKGGYTVRHTTVGSYVPNAWGIYDMHGNVLEWCLDYYAETVSETTGVTDPLGPETGKGRVQRGGAAWSDARDCRSAFVLGQLSWHGPYSYGDFGFRIAMTADNNVTPTTFTVMFNANGGSGGTTRSVTSGATVGTLPTPTRSGYAFDGWWTSASGGSQVSATTTVTGNVTYYARWTATSSSDVTRPMSTAPAPMYTVTFVNKDGECCCERVVTAGEAVGVLPAVDDYSDCGSEYDDVCVGGEWLFLGWYTAPSGGTKITTSTKVASDVTYYEHWMKKQDLKKWGSQKVGNYWWSYVFDGKDTTVMYVFPEVKGNVTVPAKLGGHPVTALGQGLFIPQRMMGASFTGVTIPATVTSIGDRVFCGLRNLKSVNIPKGVKSIGSLAFADCESLTSVTIPSSVTSIGDGAFSGCRKLAKNNFIIVNNVVYGYTGRDEAVTVPDGVTGIGQGAFSGCWEWVDDDNCVYCGPRRISLPGSVTSIGDYAFDGCEGLEELNIPDGVVRIGARAFCGCKKLARNGFIIVKGILYGYLGGGGQVAIPDGVTRIEVFATEDAEDNGVTGVTIPDSVTSIAKDAFYYYCPALRSVSLPESLLAKVEANHVFDNGGIDGPICGSGECDDDDECWLCAFPPFSNPPALSYRHVANVPVYFDANGGSLPEGNMMTVPSGAALGALPTPTRGGGYEFVGWFTAPVGGTNISSATTASGWETYYAQWVAPKPKPQITCGSSYTIVPGQACDIPISVVSSIKKTTVTVKGLPAGLKYANGKITGKAKKPGTSKVTITAKNMKGTATKKITIKAKNPGFMVSVTPQTVNGQTSGADAVASGGTVTVRVGFRQAFALAATPGADGVASSSASVKVTGLPSGLSYKSGKISGVPRAAGTKTVTVKCSNKWGWSKTFTFKIKATALPSTVVGTFNGFTSAEPWYAFDMNNYTNCVFDWRSRNVRVSATSGGKLSAKIGGTSWSASAWKSIEDGLYLATLDSTAGDGNVLEVRLDPSAAWNSFQMKGRVLTSSGYAACVDYSFTAQRNPFGKNSKKKYINATAGNYVSKMAKYGKAGMDCDYDSFGGWYYDICGESCFPNGVKRKWTSTIAANGSGTMTFAGKIGGVKVSGTTVLRISPTIWDAPCYGFGWVYSSYLVWDPYDEEYTTELVPSPKCLQADFCLGTSARPVRMHVQFYQGGKIIDALYGWATVGKHTLDEIPQSGDDYWDDDY